VDFQGFWVAALNAFDRLKGIFALDLAANGLLASIARYNQGIEEA